MHRAATGAPLAPLSIEKEGMTIVLHGTSRQNERGHLEIGGVDVLSLAERYGTPLYVYDVALIRERARKFQKAFKEAGLKAQVAYASKAFSSVAMIQLAEQEGLSLDVVSGGELFTAIKAGFPAERIHFHGNNKSPEELAMALEHQIGCIVLDNFHEIAITEDLCKRSGQTVDVLLRITPGVEAHTHDYITTGQEDSKFGFDLHNGQVEQAIEQVLRSSAFKLLGVHCHIGSQIFDTAGFVLAADKIFEKLAEWRETYSFIPEVLNLGGGFGIRYTKDDEPLAADVYVEKSSRRSKQMPSISALTSLRFGSNQAGLSSVMRGLRCTRSVLKRGAGHSQICSHRRRHER